MKSRSLDRQRLSLLETQLRPHWVEPITDDGEIRFRDSLDEALTHLQLMELAVETGYLTVKDVRRVARQEICSLLWSHAARSFVENYDYFAVRSLVVRLDVDLGLPAITLPPVHSGGEIGFAAFLAHHAEWTDDRAIDLWLRLLDSYTFTTFPDGPAAFVRFLKGRRYPESSSACIDHYRGLVTGMQRFIESLGELLSAARGEDALAYALFYAY